MYNITKQNPVVSALVAATATLLIGLMSYIVLEPVVAAADTDTNTFTVTQTIGAEIAFSTTQNDLNMSQAIGGATGGTATGTATVAVTSNDSTGYTITIQFSSTTAMSHTGDLDVIENYGSSTPDVTMNLGNQLSAFAYSVSSTNAHSDWVTCGGGDSVDECYAMHGTPNTPRTIVDSNGVATAEETQIGFKVMVAADSGLVNGEYQATTTLTAATKT